MRHRAFGLSLLVGFTFAIPSAATAGSVEVTVTIERMHCVRPTEQGLKDGDEVYVAVRGRTPRGEVARTLPGRDDYYEFRQDTDAHEAGWPSRKRKAQNRPILWTGRLSDGQSAELLVFLGEHARSDVKPVSEITAAAGRALSGADAESEAGKTLAGVPALAAKLTAPDGDNVIGAFAVTVRNDGGALKTSWLPVLDAEHLVGDGNPATAGFPDGAFFVFRGTAGSEYHLIANAAAEEPAVGRSMAGRGPAGRTPAGRAAAGGPVLAEMADFLRSFDGTGEGVDRGLAKYAAEGTDTSAIAGIAVANPRLMKADRGADGSVVYTVACTSGILSRLYEIAWKDGKIASVSQLKVE